MSHRKANEAVRQWAAVVAAERAKEATMTRALLKMLASMEAAGWRRWVYVFRRSADVERKMTRVLKHVLNAFAAAGWNQWVAQVARLADAEATVVRVLKHMLHRAASQAWRAWHGRVVELRVLSIHASAVRERQGAPPPHDARRLQSVPQQGRRLVALAFSTWLRHGNLLAEWRASQERACAVSDRCLRKLVARGLAKGLRQWVRAVGSEKRDRLDVLRRIGRCVHDPVRALRRLNALDAWTGWRTWVLATAELRALAERQRAACDVVLRLFADGDARKRRAGWLSWRLHQRTMVRLDHLFGRWTHSKQAAGFSAWVDVYMRALDRDRAGALALRALRQLARRDLARALHTWVGFLAAAEVASREAHVRDLTRSRACARAARLVLRQGDRALAAGLRRWAEAVRDRRRAEAIVVKTLSHMSHRTLHLAWMAWRAAARAATEALHALALRFEGQRLRLRSILQVAEARAKLDAMRGLMRWISFASRSRHATAARSVSVKMAERVLRRCQSRSLSRGFHAWSTVMFEDSASSLSAKLRAEQARTTMFGRLATSAHDPLRALKRLDKLGAWTGLRTWKAATDLARAAADARHRGASRALASLRGADARKLRAALHTWVLHRRAAAKCERLVKRWTRAVAGRLLKKAEALAWRRWVVAARLFYVDGKSRELARLKEAQACVRAAALLSNRNLRATHGRWRSWVAFVREENGKRDTMRRVLLRAYHGAQSRAVRQWAAQIRDFLESERRMKRVVGKMGHRASAAGFDAWRRATAAEAAREHQMRHVLVELSKHALAAAVRQWKAVVVDHERKKRRVRAAVGRLGHRKAAGAFRSWRDATRRARDVERKCVRVILKMTHRRTHSAFRSWLLTARSERRAEALCGKVLKRMANLAVFAAFHEWACNARALKAVEERCRRVASRMAHRKLWAAFRQWDLEARACAAAEGTMRRVLVTMCHRAAHDALRQWVCVVADLKAADRKVLRCVGRMLSCAVAAGWRRWLEVDARCVAVEATVRRTVKHLLHRSQSLAWRLWVAKTIERRVAALRASSVADGDAVRLVRIRRALYHRCHGLARKRLFVGWNTWLERRRGAAAPDRAFALADRCLRRMQRGALYAGFRRWGAGARRADQGLQGVFDLGALHGRGAGDGGAPGAGRARRRAALLGPGRARAGLTSWVLHQRTMVKLDGLFGRWQRSAEWGAWSAWRRAVEDERVRARRASRSALGRSRGNLALAWRSWAAFLREAREADLEARLDALRRRESCGRAAAPRGRAAAPSRAWRVGRGRGGPEARRGADPQDAGPPQAPRGGRRLGPLAPRARGDEDLVAGWRRRERDHRLKVLFWDLDGKRSGALRKALLVWSGANSSHTRNLRIVARCARGSAPGPARGAERRLLLKDRDALLRAWVLWQAQVWVAQEAYWRAQRIVPEAQRSTRVTLSSAMAAAERTVRRMLRKRLGAGWRAWIDALGAHRALHRREETMRLVVRRMRRRSWSSASASGRGARARARRPRPPGPGPGPSAPSSTRSTSGGGATSARPCGPGAPTSTGSASRAARAAWCRAFAKIAHRGAADALRRWRAFLQRLDAAEAAARRCARALRRWDMRDAGRALATWRRKAESELALEVAGRAGGVLDSPERTFGEWFGSSKRGRRSRSPSPARGPEAARAADAGGALRRGKCTPIYFHGMPMLRVTALFEGVVEKVTHTVGPLAITQHAYLHRAPAARASPAKARRAAPLEFFEPSSRAIAQFDKACRTRPVDTVADLAYERERRQIGRYFGLVYGQGQQLYEVGYEPVLSCGRWEKLEFSDRPDDDRPPKFASCTLVADLDNAKFQLADGGRGVLEVQWKVSYEDDWHDHTELHFDKYTGRDGNFCHPSDILKMWDWDEDLTCRYDRHDPEFESDEESPLSPLMKLRKNASIARWAPEYKREPNALLITEHSKPLPDFSSFASNSDSESESD
ncbi:hypothetical protein JL720_15424 [Aureococcus anophagefferens]|nr:hypothetical protein JL720_15424 [Aureococcus anophagefferens]